MASIYHLNQGQTTLFATGFTNITDITDITDIAEGADGTLYVLENATNGIYKRKHRGLWALSADGLSRELLMTDGAW